MTGGVINDRERGKGYFKPIPRDPVFEKMDKNSMAYRFKQRRLACILCVDTATQKLVSG